MKLKYFISIVGFLLVRMYVFAQIPGYSFYKTITVQASEVEGSGSLINFPMLFSEIDPDLANTGSGGSVQSIEGYDIAFTLDDGTTILEHQIEKYTPSTGEFVAWVKIPSLDALTNTDLHIYYGNPAITSDPSLETVWDANYVSVYHLTTDLNDKTQNNNDLINYGTTNNGTGAAADSRNFEQGDYLQAPTDGSFLISQNLTVSAWVDVDVLQTGAYENMIIDVGGIDESNIENKLYNFNLLSTGQLGVLWENSLGVDTDVTSSNAITFPSSGFTMLSFTRDVALNQIRFYQDGIELDIAPSAYAVDTDGGGGAELSIGINQQFPALDYDGAMDEIRISNNIRSQAWLRTNFNSINSPSTFYLLGNEIPLCNAEIAYSDNQFCANDGTVLPTLITDAGGTFSSSPAGLILNASNGEINFSNTTAGNYDIEYTAPLGCSEIFSINVNSEDDASFTFPSSLFCSNSADTDPDFIAMPGGTWNSSPSGLDLDSGDGEIEIEDSNPGIYTIYYTTNGTCPNTSSVNIEILPPIDPYFWIPDTICLSSGSIDLDDSTSLQINESSSFYSYGTNGAAVLGGTNNNVLQPNPTGPGTYFVTHVISSTLGCIDSATLVVDILPVYNANFSLPDTLCSVFTNYNLNDFLTISTDSGGIWSGAGVVNDSIWNSGNLPVGNYELTYVVGIGQCADTVTKTTYLKPDVDSSWTAPSVMCSNAEAINLDNYVTGTQNGVWSGTGVSGNLFDPSLAQAGVHNVTYTADGFACSKSSTLPITVYQAPIINAGLDNEICDTIAQLSAQSNLPDLGYWLNEPNTIFTNDSSDEFLTIVVSNPGTYTYYYFVDQSGICSETDSVTITFDAIPTAIAGEDQFLDFRFETNLAASQPEIGTGVWTLLEGEGEIWNNNDANSFVNELGTGANEFLWTVTNGSCPEQTDRVLITVNDLWIPDVLTPNGDGKNDFFEIKGIESKENKIEIYNRWGQLRFQEENYQNSWDGRDLSGNLLENDTYYYVITIENDRIVNGYVVLKK